MKDTVQHSQMGSTFTPTLPREVPDEATTLRLEDELLGQGPMLPEKAPDTEQQQTHFLFCLIFSTSFTTLFKFKKFLKIY